MKRVCNFFAPAVVAMALGLTGCAKEDPAKPLEVDWNRTAKVEVNILYNTDVTLSPQKLSAPASLVVTASIPYSALNSGASGVYLIPKEKITYAGGKLTVETPVGLSGATVTISVSSFAGERRQITGNVTGIWSLSENIQKHVYPGQTEVLPFKTLDFDPDKKAGDDA